MSKAAVSICVLLFLMVTSHVLEYNLEENCWSYFNFQELPDVFQGGCALLLSLHIPTELEASHISSFQLYFI